MQIAIVLYPGQPAAVTELVSREQLDEANRRIRELETLLALCGEPAPAARTFTTAGPFDSAPDEPTVAAVDRT